MAARGATFESIAFGYLCIPELKKKKRQKEICSYITRTSFPAFKHKLWSRNYFKRHEIPTPALNTPCKLSIDPGSMVLS